jgi:glucokinase
VTATKEGPALLLAADIGGTHAGFMIGERQGEACRVLFEKFFPSRECADFGAALERFLALPEAVLARPHLKAACFAVAGPVADNVSTLTNLGWKVDAAEVSHRFQLPQVQLINDFHAAGLGVTGLPAASLTTLQSAEAPEHGTAVIIGAGTGLGVGIINWNGTAWEVLPSEAGHADFAPTDELQDRLLMYLRRTYGRVSWERVISGPGLMRVFSFLQDSGLGIPSKQLLEATKRHNADPPEVIAEYAMAKLDPLAVRALDLFIAAYGSFAGNMALGALARGGVYIAGGIAPKIVNRLKDGSFMRAFTGKGAFTPLLSGIPVRVVMDAQVGLRGALRVAGEAAKT